MNNVKISLVFACYNVSQYLNDLYNLLLSQPYKNIEILFVEDCSTDNTRDILRSFSDPRVKLIENTENQGAAISRNIGIDNASGDYIWFPDPDDLFDKNFIMESVKIITTYSPDIIMCGMVEEYEIDGKLKYKKDILSKYSGVISGKENITDILIDLEETFLFGYTNNKMYKKSFLISNKIRNKKLALKEDFEFNLNAFSFMNELFILNKPYYFYKKRNNSSLTNKFVKEYFDIHMDSLFGFRKLIESKYKITSDVERLLVNRFIRYFLSAIERNTNELSNLNFSQQISWVKDVLKDDKYKCFLTKLDLLSGKIRVLKNFFKPNFSFFLVFLGFFIKNVKSKLPILFSKIK